MLPGELIHDRIMSISKRILPEGFNFDVPAVEIVDTYSKGLNKTAMAKRASADAFSDVLENLKPKKGRTYLHVITTGAQEYYQANRNGDDFVETYQHVVFPYPEDAKRKSYDTDGGLKKYHNKTYMDSKSAVYQEHKSKEKPSGEIIAARYNEPMHRGELIIAVDTDKWAPRLQKKASGQDIYLSMGCQVKSDCCRVCGRIAKTAAEHCNHFKHMRCQIMDDGTQCSVINDAPHFYDISGVDVPADKIAFVLRKVASGEQVKEAAFESKSTYGVRVPMLLTKSARLLNKLSKMEKQLEALVESVKDEDDAAFRDDPEVQDKFILKVENYPVDEIIDSCNRKGILLSPGMLFNLLGKECSDEEGAEDLLACDDDCCGDCSAMLRELEDDEETRNQELLDGSFDQHFPVDLNLDSILETFVPELGMSNQAVAPRAVRIIIVGKPKREKKQRKEASSVAAQEALRRTYARYFISFAAQNSDSTCLNALRKVASYGK